VVDVVVQETNSQGDLLQLFRSGRASTRNDVRRVTGLARSTVAYKIEALLNAGFLIEDGSLADGRGRPSTRLRVNDHQTTVLAADLGMTHGRLAVSTAAGDVLAETVIESSIRHDPETVLALIAEEFDRLWTTVDRSKESLRGIGMGVPGPVDWATGRIARSISMPGWDNYPVGQHLVDRYAVPAVVDNDANMLGLGEQRRIYPDAHQVVFVKVGTGIGASVIVDGNLLRGSASAEGDIGHAKVRGVTETCSTCGATGCLAAIASGRAMARDLRRLGREAETTNDVVDLVRAGDAQAVRIVTDAGRALGEVLSTAVSLLNPDVVVIGGDIAHAHEHFLLGVRGAVLERSQPLASANLIITPTKLGDRAGIAGVAEMVADAVFSSAAVDAAIGASSGSAAT
jgi:predicted NBD/HSP70 family sugar kinase